MTWFTENLGTILITLLLVAAVAGIIVSLVRQRKKGGSSCGCGCATCAMKGACHRK